MNSLESAGNLKKSNMSFFEKQKDKNIWKYLEINKVKFNQKQICRLKEVLSWVKGSVKQN